MRNIGVNELDEKSLVLVKYLRDLGITRNEALLIVYLLGVEVSTSKEIRWGTGLWQPDVSKGMKMLRSRDWVREEELEGEKKGRPTKVYCLNVALSEIVRYLEEKNVRDASRAMASIQKLKELAPSL